MFTRSTALRLGLPVFVALLAGASFAPSAYLNSSALSEIDTSRGFCVHEPSLDPKRINGSKTIQRMFGEAGRIVRAALKPMLSSGGSNPQISGSTTPICRHFAQAMDTGVLAPLARAPR